MDDSKLEEDDEELLEEDDDDGIADCKSKNACGLLVGDDDCKCKDCVFESTVPSVDLLADTPELFRLSTESDIFSTGVEIFFFDFVGNFTCLNLCLLLRGIGGRGTEGRLDSLSLVETGLCPSCILKPRR